MLHRAVPLAPQGSIRRAPRSILPMEPAELPRLALWTLPFRARWIRVTAREWLAV
jgi:hypothetical protein